MKKIILSLVAAIVVVTASYAQSSLLATLSHEGSIQTFYGANALQQAHNAAQNGDVITLSEGSFNSVDITKGVTIRGVGMLQNDETKTFQTKIIGDFNINIADSTARLTLEGIWHDGQIYNKGYLKSPNILKCRLRYLYLASASYAGSVTVDATIIHCRIYSIKLNNKVSSMQCFNSILNGLDMSSNQRAIFENCICFCSTNLESSLLRNCILYSNSTGSYMSSTNSLSNCYFVENAKMNSGTSCIGCQTGLKYADVFKTFKGSYSDSSNFELTENASTTLLGIDGTQAGIYGGNMPYSPVPTSPQITKCNVAAKSTIDGKLSVDITVKGAE